MEKNNRQQPRKEEKSAKTMSSFRNCKLIVNQCAIEHKIYRKSCLCRFRASVTIKRKINLLPTERQINRSSESGRNGKKARLVFLLMTFKLIEAIQQWQ